MFFFTGFEGFVEFGVEFVRGSFSRSYIFDVLELIRKYIFVFRLIFY